jgi:hypothetical protein
MNPIKCYSFKLYDEKDFVIFTVSLHHIAQAGVPKFSAVFTYWDEIIFCSLNTERVIFYVSHHIVHGSEIWTWKQRNIRRLKTAELKFMRSKAGYIFLDRRRSGDILEELKVELVEKKLAQYKQKSLNHISGMKSQYTQNNSLTINLSEEDLDDH